MQGSTSHKWVENTIDCLALVWKHQRRFLESFHDEIDLVSYSIVAYDNYSWALYQLGSRFCPLTYREKRRQLLKLGKIMEFNAYRSVYPLKMQHGLMRVKFSLIKYHLEGLILLFGSLYYKM